MGRLSRRWLPSQACPPSAARPVHREQVQCGTDSRGTRQRYRHYAGRPSRTAPQNESRNRVSGISHRQRHCPHGVRLFAIVGYLRQLDQLGDSHSVFSRNSLSRRPYPCAARLDGSRNRSVRSRPSNRDGSVRCARVGIHPACGAAVREVGDRFSKTRPSLPHPDRLRSRWPGQGGPTSLHSTDRERFWRR